MTCYRTVWQFLRTVALSALLANSINAATIVDFEDLTLAAESAAPGNAGQSPFLSHGVEFNRTYVTDFDCCPGAWAYSNQTDTVTPGYLNSYSAVSANGGGANGSANYAVAYNSFLGEATVTLPQVATVEGAYLTNSTYAYRAIVDGVDSADPNNPRQFIDGPLADGGFVKLEIFGLNQAGETVGSVDFFLADYRNGRVAIQDWTWVDLSGLGSDIRQLQFQMESTQQNEFGMATPSYFAMDNLTVAYVPEPNRVSWLVAVFLLAKTRIRTKRDRH
ncbi:MAG: DUF4465 domain-containing protein [Planctomycetales bacterium]|nr:DUF4465 domain-containing protein [Planctomycetales bacterium]